MTHEYFMNEALRLAGIALKEGEFPVGCVIVFENKIIVSGSRKGTIAGTVNETDHAEIIALRNLSDTGINNDIDRSRMTLYSTMEPCLMCFGAILLSGIGTIVYAFEDVMGGGTKIDLKTLSPLYRNRKLSVIPGVLRSKSLEIFKAYFSNPSNFYWRGSLLADYTLAQKD
ncbi:MAG: nucleoside deaminase [Proteobacteria bacterium]|nr:nucleoside deaminase [Pseudomonadota bacterium]